MFLVSFSWFAYLLSDLAQLCTGIHMLEGLGYASLIRSEEASAQHDFESDREYGIDGQELGNLIEQVVDQVEGLMEH